MPAPPNIDYLICPDGSTAIGDNCGSSVPLYQQEQIALAKIKLDELNVGNDPIDPIWLKNMHHDLVDPIATTPPKVETILGNGLTNGQKWAWVIGLTLAAWGLIYWSEKQGK
jgi:hypothetical protein